MTTRHSPESLRQYIHLTLEQAESKFRNGSMTQTEWDHYRYHWRNSAHRYSKECAQFQDDTCPVCGEKFNAS